MYLILIWGKYSCKKQKHELLVNYQMNFIQSFKMLLICLKTLTIVFDLVCLYYSIQLKEDVEFRN